jgi:ectoine hydroxylase-related dioxygenase (phytanoyl-CoA dioxygenase family)
MKKIFKINNLNGIEDFFVQQGFCVIRGIYEKKKVIELEKMMLKLDKKYLKLSKKFDYQSFAIASHKIFEKKNLFEYFYKNRNLIKVLKLFYGTDIIHINYSRFQINRKKIDIKSKKQSTEEIKFQQFKGLHNDHWTGSSEYTMHYWMPFSGVDKNNAMIMYPGSHLNGSFPVLNREIDPTIKFRYKPHNLSYLKNGDVVLFHSLLLHRTAEKTLKTRMAELSRFTSPNFKMTNQELDLGFKSLAIGPMRRIIRTIGNDALTPFRTYGSVSGIDRVVCEVYRESQPDKKAEHLYNILSK